jgi:TolB-like protein/Tfp pilus assembly protein PilF
MDLLVALARRPGEVMAREALLDEVWAGVVVGDDVLTQAVTKLRRALGEGVIETISKRGYRLVAPVKWEEAASRRPKRIVWAIAAAAVIALGAGYWRYANDEKQAVEKPAEQLDTLPKVVVHSFAEIQGDGAQALLARGLTAHFVTDLGRIPGIRVITLGSGAPGEPAESRAGRAGSYSLKGEVQRGGDKIRLYIQLADASTGESLWSERYDRPYGDLLSLEDELSERVLEKLRPAVRGAELRRQARPYTRNLQAYEYFLRAQSALLVRRKAENELARRMYARAIELDPAFARAHAGLALTYAADRRNGWAADGAAALDKALALAKQAREIDPEIPETHFAFAFVEMERGSLNAATDALRTALKLNPSYADAYALLGGIHTYEGRPRETIPLIHTAMRLAPDAGHLYYLILGRALYFMGDAKSAEAALRQALARNPESVESHLYLAATLARSAPGDAAWEADQIRALEPGFSAIAWLKTYPMTDAGQRRALGADLERLKL